MCGNMVDIQPPTAEIRRGKKRKIEEDRKKLQSKNIMSASATQGGHNKLEELVASQSNRTRGDTISL